MKKNKELEKQLKEKEKIINELLADRDRWFLKYNESLNNNSMLSDELKLALERHDNVIASYENSPFWKLSGPIRSFLDKRKGRIPQEEIIQDIVEEKTVEPTYIDPYEIWIKENEINLNKTEKLQYNPLISIIVPSYDVNKDTYNRCLKSLLKQTYNNIQIIVVGEILDKNKKIEYIKSSSDNPANLVNIALSKIKGQYITIIDCHDVLAINAIYECVKALNENKDIDIIYTDEDRISKDNKSRIMPFFKPDYSIDTIMSFNYIGDICLFKKNLLKNIKVNEQYQNYKYDLVLRLLEKTTAVKHIDKVLIHKRNMDNVFSQDDIDIKKAMLKRRKIAGRVDDNGYIIYANKNELISIIIPSKDNPDVLFRCIDSIKQLTTYKNYEIIVIDNGSNLDNQKKINKYLKKHKAKYIYDQYEFNFSKMCNIGVKYSKGEYLLFLNDDITVKQSDWLDRLLGQARLKHCGAAGAKLLYPDSDLIQHCGVINYPYEPSHCYTKCSDQLNLNYYRNKCNYNVIAVTAACMMIKKKKFNEIGGFCLDMPVNYNDVDLCFRIDNKGYKNIIRNDVILDHYESLSRGNDLLDITKLEKLVNDRRKLYERNPDYLLYDPYYNKNLAYFEYKG